MSLCTRSILALATTSMLSVAANDPFIGTWMFNPAKSNFTGLRFTIENLGQNRYKFMSGTEADAETFTIDGSYQASRYGYLVAIKKQGPNVWVQTYKKDDTVTGTDTETLSADGKTMTSEYHGVRVDGTPVDSQSTAKRISGDNLSDWAGTWETASYNTDSRSEWVITSYQRHGLSFTFPRSKDVLNMKFDGKDYAETGPRVPPGSTSSGKRLNPRTLEITEKLKGHVEGVATYQVSEDGETLTVTARLPGQTKLMTQVWDRK
jgi:hypothetical protein